MSVDGDGAAADFTAALDIGAGALTAGPRRRRRCASTAAVRLSLRSRRRPARLSELEAAQREGGVRAGGPDLHAGSRPRRLAGELCRPVPHPTTSRPAIRRCWPRRWSSRRRGRDQAVAAPLRADHRPRCGCTTRATPDRPSGRGAGRGDGADMALRSGDRPDRRRPGCWRCGRARCCRRPANGWSRTCWRASLLDARAALAAPRRDGPSRCAGLRLRRRPRCGSCRRCRRSTRAAAMPRWPMSAVVVGRCRQGDGARGRRGRCLGLGASWSPTCALRPQPAEVRSPASGPITAMLSLLDQPPLQVMQKAGRPVDAGRGPGARWRPRCRRS